MCVQANEKTTTISPEAALELTQLLERQLGPDAPIYDHFSQIPNDPPIFLFNYGHVTHQLQPFLSELFDTYGATAYKVKKAEPAKKMSTEGQKATVIYVGIQPEQLLRFVEKHINPGRVADLLLNFLISVTEHLPIDSLRSLLQEKASGRVDLETVRTVIFAFRQQLGQFNNPSQYVHMAEAAGEKNMLAAIDRSLASLQQTFISLTRQYNTGKVFFDGLLKFSLQSPGNRARIDQEKLHFELQNAAEMLKEIEDILVQETMYAAKIAQIKSKVSQRGSEPNLQ